MPTDAIFWLNTGLTTALSLRVGSLPIHARTPTSGGCLTVARCDQQLAKPESTDSAIGLTVTKQYGHGFDMSGMRKHI